MSHWLNPKRLRDYPRLFFFTTWLLLLGNWVFHNGWLGAAGQLIGNDFLVFYSAGMLYRTNPQALYDPIALHVIQSELIAPTPVGGMIPYINPPWVAPVFALLTVVPYGWAFAAWTMLNIACLAVAAHLLVGFIIPAGLQAGGLTRWQMFFIVGGYMGFVEGLEVGQNHGLSLLLVCVAVAFSLHRGGKFGDLAAGVAAGLLLYKPQFALAFIVVWLAWGRWISLAGFSITAAGWLGTSLALQGLEPYWTYLNLLPGLVELHQLRGSGSYLEVTLNGFLVSVLGSTSWRWVSGFSLALSGLAALGLAGYAFWGRRQAEMHRAAGLILAVLYPLIFAPHALLHDSVILAAAFALWSRFERSKALLWVVVAIYLAAFTLVWVTYQSGIALFGIIPVGLAVGLVDWLRRHSLSGQAEVR